jgi:hypothetical protein
MATTPTYDASKYLDRPRTKLRRVERGLEDAEWIDRFLSTCAAGHCAIAWEGQPLIHSNLYWHDGADRVYWHTAPVGKFRAVVEQGPLPACFTIMEHGRMLPAGTPFDFSTEYASVVLYGTVRVVTDRDEKRRGLEGLMAKYAAHLKPGVDYEPMPDSDIDATSVFCLDVDERVAKHNVKPDDYPAYRYEGGGFIDTERAAGRVTMKMKEIA